MNIASLRCVVQIISRFELGLHEFRSYVTDDALIEHTISTTFSSTPTLSTGGSTPPSRSDTASIGTNATSSTAAPSSRNGTHQFRLLSYISLIQSTALSKSVPSVGVVVGSVVAGVILFALLVSGTLWFICRRRRARRQPAITFTPQFVSPYQHDAEDTPPREGLVSEKRRRAAIIHGTKPHMPSSEASSASSQQPNQAGCQVMIYETKYGSCARSSYSSPHLLSTLHSRATSGPSSFAVMYFDSICMVLVSVYVVFLARTKLFARVLHMSSACHLCFCSSFFDYCNKPTPLGDISPEL